VTIPPLTFNVSPMTRRTLLREPYREILDPCGPGIVDAVKSGDRRVCLGDAVLPIVEPDAEERL
jgi:hypothetical protein